MERGAALPGRCAPRRRPRRRDPARPEPGPPDERRRRRRLRGAARVPQGHSRRRLHGLQAAEPRSAASGAGWTTSAASPSATISTTSQVTPTEYQQLFETLLINVTEFFRDGAGLGPPARRGAARRCWRPSPPTSRCASGAPAARPARRPTRCAMVLAELLGVDAYRERVKIYATDIDEDALTLRAPRGLHRQGDRVGAAGAARALLRGRRPPAGVPQGPAPDRDLRPQQPRPGRADLAPGPAGLPQHADVLQRGDAVAHPAPLPLRAASTPAR